MKTLALAALLALTVGCTGSDTARDTTPKADLTQTDDELDSVEPATTDCSQEVALECAEGSVDGCGIRSESGESLTLYHVCIPEAEQSKSTACELEILRECAEGFVDACTVDPPAASTHICVAAPASDSQGEMPDQDGEGDQAAPGDDQGEAGEDSAE